MNIKLISLALGAFAACCSTNVNAFGAVAWDNSLPAYTVGGVVNMKTAASADKEALETCVSSAVASRIPRASANCHIGVRFHHECALRVLSKDGAPTGTTKLVQLGTQAQATQELAAAECPNSSCIVSPLCDSDDVQ